MFFQIALEAVYWRQEKDFITNETKVPVSVELGVIYSLFAFEFLILTSIIYARHVQGRSTSKGSEAIKESERKSNAEILKRRTQMLNGGNSLYSPNAEHEKLIKES